MGREGIFEDRKKGRWIIMMEQKIRNAFKQEWEIPDEVETKMQEAYRQIGAGRDVIMNSKDKKRAWQSGRRYLKAASIVAAVLLIGTTATAAAAGFNFGLLKNLFGDDAELVRQSSSKPEILMGKGKLDHLEIEVEGMSGTEEVTYVMLHVKRTDGRKFTKNARYTFDNVEMESEVNIFEKPGSFSGASFTRCLPSENEGTSDLHLTFACGHKRMENGETISHLGEKYTLRLENLMEWPKNPESESEGTVVAEGKTELNFALDYEEAVTVKKEPNVNISFPEVGKKKRYASVGKLTEVIITPYYVKYATEQKDIYHFLEGAGDFSAQLEDGVDVWQEIYLEMDDGSKIGFMTMEEYVDYIVQEDGVSNLGAFGTGNYSDKKNVWRNENMLGFPKLIDVEHVRAIYFGKTRIEID